jgi:hypothetical protein
LIFVVWGGVALARTGIDLHHLTRQHVQVAGAGQTQLSAYLELGYGILMLAAASVADAGRGLMMFLALMALAFGLIVAIQPSSFRHSLGVIGGGYGAFLTVVGIIVIIAALIAPVFGGATHWSGTHWSSLKERSLSSAAPAFGRLPLGSVLVVRGWCV